MQREIDGLKKKLCHAQRKRSPSSSDMSSNDEGTIIIGKDQELLQVRPSLMKKNTIIDVDARAHPIRAWEMML